MTRRTWWFVTGAFLALAVTVVVSRQLWIASRPSPPPASGTKAGKDSAATQDAKKTAEVKVAKAAKKKAKPGNRAGLPDPEVLEKELEELQEKTKARQDEPDAAAEFEASKRRPIGASDVPIDRYLAASEQLPAMSGYSSATGQKFAAGSLSAAASLSNWSFLGPGNIGGRTRSILIDPSNANIMYLGGAAGGVWKTTNAGASWAPVGDILPNLAVSSMAMDPANSSVIYAGTGEGFFNIDAARGAGIYKTTDAGVTWNPLVATTTSSAFWFVNKLVISPVNSNRLYAATATGVWRSTDAGANWSQVLNSAANNGCLDLVIRTDKPTDYVFAACGNFAQARIYRNTDAGGAGDWVEVHTELNMGRTSLALAPSNQNIIYALASSIESGTFYKGLLAVFRSTASGDIGTWATQVRNTSAVLLNRVLLSNPYFAMRSNCEAAANQFLNQGWYDNVIAVDPVNTDIVWAGGTDLFRSNDGGQNWGVASYWWVAPNSAHADQHVLKFHPGYNGTTNQILYAGDDGGIYRSSNARAAVATGNTAVCNSGNTSVAWTNLNNGIGITQFYHGLPYPTGTSFFGGAQDNGTIRGTTAGGPNAWTTVMGGDGGYVALDPGNTNTLYAEFTGISIQKSTNGGGNFSAATTGITGDTGFLFIAPFMMDPNNAQRLWTGGGFIWRTVNGAASWTQASAALNGSVSALAIAPGNSEIVAVGTTRGNVYVTQTSSATNSATNWATSVPRSGYISWVAFDPSNTNTLYATFSTFKGVASEAHVYRSTNLGSTWTPIDGSGATSIPDIPVHSIVVDPLSPQRLFVGSDLGVFVSEDGGATWNREIAAFAPAITESLSILNVGGAYSLYAFTHGRGAWKTSIAAPSACTYVLTPNSRSVVAAGVSGSFTVSTAAACAWTAISNAAWVTFSGATNGTGNGTVNYNIQANPGAPRQSTMTVGAAGVTSNFTVNQDGVSGGSNDEAGGATLIPAIPATLTQNTTTATKNPADPVHSCTSSADSRTVWFRYVASFSGVLSATTLGSGYDTVLTVYPGTVSPGAELACNDDGGGTLQSSLTFNVTNGQSYLIEVSGFGATNAGGPLTLSVSQVGACPVTIAPPSNTFNSEGGNGSIAVTAPACSWSAVSNAAWITILSGALGTGNGTVQYFVGSNPSGTSRTGTITVGSQTFTITQILSCSYTLSAGSQSFPSAGGPGSVGVTTLAGCSWTASTADAWINITSALSFTGSGTVTYTAGINAAAAPRTGTITIAGQAYSVIQSGTGLANDESGTATLIPALPFVLSQSTTVATTNAANPIQSCNASANPRGFNTVWFRFAPNSSGSVRMDTIGSSYDTVLTAYRTSVSAPNEIACNDDTAPGLTSQIFFNYSAGETYLIVASAFGTGGGTLQFRATQVTNDETVGATTIGALPFATTQAVHSATANASDPVHSCTGAADAATVWFRYVATFTGILNVSTFGSDYDTVVSAYPAAMSPELGCDDDASVGRQSQLSFTVTNGQTYFIEVAAYSGTTGGNLILNAVRLTNDDPLAPTNMPALPFTVTQDVRAATAGAGEPQPSCLGFGFHIVWFRHVAVFTGTAQFMTENSDYDTVLAVYSGTSGPAAQLACNDDADLTTLTSKVTLNLVAGNTYFIGVSSFDADLGFSGTLFLSGQSGSTQLATLLTPVPGSVLPGASVNFNWSAGLGVSAYRLTLGNSVGASDIFNGAQTNLLTAAAGSIPTDGRIIHARLYSLVGASFFSNDYTYQAAGSGPQPPTAVSVTPSSGVGSPQTFTFVFSDPNGFVTIPWVQMLFNSSLTGVAGCYTHVDRASSVVLLLNDAATGWLGPVPLGTANTLQNSQCTVNAQTSSASGVSNNFTVNLTLTFNPSFGGTKNIYMQTVDNGGLVAVWAQRGTWTPFSNQAPSTISVTPAAGTGSVQTFSFAYSDPNGRTDLQWAQMIINSSLTGSAACFTHYDRPSNAVLLLNDDATAFLGPVTVGTVNTLQNSQCIVNARSSSASSVGNNLTVNLDLTFKNAFIGAKKVYTQTIDTGGLGTGWTQLGTWTVNNPVAPSAVSVTPGSGSGSSQNFSFLYSDANGFGDMPWTQMIVNGSLNGTGACYTHYDRASNSVLLLNDAGTAFLGPITLGAASTLQNSQCTVSAISSSAVGVGANLTVNLNLTFKPAFAGVKNVYMYTLDNGGLATGWQLRGTWTAQ